MNEVAQVTNCIMAELRNLGPKARGAMIIGKGYYRIQCGHDKKALPVKESLLYL